jgi:putative zinc finger protein
MTEHPTGEELEQYWRRALSPATLLFVQRHVATCPRCAEQSPPQQQADDFEDLRAALLPAADQAPYHLSADEFISYRRGELSEIDLEIVESHFITCAPCRDEAQLPSLAAANRQEERSHVQKTPPILPRRWKPPFRRLADTRPWQVAAVVFCAAILTLLAVFLFQARKGTPPKETVQSENPVPDKRAGDRANNSESHTAPTPDEGTLTGTQLVVVLNDGGERITLDNRGELVGLERLPAYVRQAVKAALQAGRIDRPQIVAQLAGRPSTLLGPSDNGLPFQLITPVGQVVESERPMFSWSTLEGAHSYTVSVTDADLNEVAVSPPLAETVWRVTKSLSPGTIYSWQVTALKDGKPITSPVLPAPQAKFKVVDQSTLQSLQQAKRTYRGSHLAAGILYAEAGMLVEAEGELRALVRANPRDRVAGDILRSVQVMNQGRNGRLGRHHRSSPIKMNPAQ